MTYNSSEQKRYNTYSGGFSQDIFSILPKGFEGVFFVIYALLVPYILGILFYLVYIGKGMFNIFSEIPFYMTWIIGYELLSFFVILYLITQLLKYVFKK